MSQRPPAEASPALPYVWRLRRRLGERAGERCRIVSHTGLQVEVEFADGVRASAHRSAVYFANQEAAMPNTWEVVIRGEGKFVADVEQSLAGKINNDFQQVNLHCREILLKDQDGQNVRTLYTTKEGAMGGTRT